MADRNANINLAVRNAASAELRRATGDTAALVNQLRAATIAAGQSEAKFLELAGALSREALAAGNAASADQILADANRGLAVATTQTSTATQASTRASLQQAQAEARLQAALGNRSGAARIIASELARQEQRTVGVINAERQLIQIQNQASQGARTLGGSFNQLTASAQQLGIALGARQLIQFGVEAGKAALELDHIQRVTRTVAGDTATYNQIVASAREQQLLFGGSLAENIEGLSGLTVTSRNTGASLSQLIDLQKRLTILNPAQGATGGLIALNEALAGNTSSLQRRFNIPRSELKALSDTALPVADRLRVIDSFLNKVGITSAAVEQSVGRNAQAFNRLSAATDTLTANLGAGLVQSAAPVAGALASIAEGLARSEERANSYSATLARSVGPANAYAAALLAIGRATGSTPEQIARARDELSSSVGILGAYKFGIEGIAAAFERTAPATAATTLTMDDERRAAAQAGEASIEAGLAAQRHGEQLAGLATASEVAARLLQQQAVAAQLASAQSAILSQEQASVAQASALAAQGLLGAGDQAVLLAQKYGIATDQARLLILAQQRLTNAEALADQRAGERSGGTVKSARALTVQSDLARQKARRDEQEAKRLHDAQTALDLQRARTAQQRIAILQREQAATTDQAEKLRIQAQIEGERNSGARSHTSELGKQLTLNERIRDSLESQLKAQLDAAELAIRDRQERRKEDQELRVAQNALQNAKDPRFRAAAADAIALIDVQRQQRALALQEKLATAGGSIVGGRVFQSIPTGRPGQAVVGPAPAVGGVPVPGQAGGGLPIVDVRVFLDSQEIGARVITTLRTGLQSANAGGAGRGG